MVSSLPSSFVECSPACSGDAEIVTDSPRKELMLSVVGIGITTVQRSSVVDLRLLTVQDSLRLQRWAGQPYPAWNRGSEAEMGLSWSGGDKRSRTAGCVGARIWQGSERFSPRKERHSLLPAFCTRIGVLSIRPVDLGTSMPLTLCAKFSVHSGHAF